jgi:hypothetical protein
MKNFRTTKIAKKIFGMGSVSVVSPKASEGSFLSKFNFYSLGFVAMLLSLFIVSCKDNLMEEKVIDNQPLTVNLAKTWFEKNISNNSSISAANSHGFYRAIYWKKATEKVDNKTGGHYFEIPVFEVTSANLKEYDLEKVAIESLAKRSIPNAWTNLKVFKGANNLIEYQIITSIPNPEFYKNENALSTKLTGYKIIKDWNDNILKSLQVKEDIEGVELMNPKSIKNGKVAALCQFDFFTFVVDIQDGTPTITRYRNTVYYDCGSPDAGLGGGYTPGPIYGGGESTNFSQNAVNQAHEAAEELGLSEIEDILGKDPTISLPILNKCQQDAYFEYVSAAANLEHDYEVSKNDCLNTYIGAGAGGDAIMAVSGQISFKKFTTWWSTTGKFTTYRPGAVSGFIGLMSGSLLSARQCVENKLKDTNYKILSARKLFDKKYAGNCQ